MPQHLSHDAEMDACIQSCLACYEDCQREAMQHCLELGGRHVEPAHFRLMIDCAESCRSTAAAMLNGSSFHAAACALCAEICRACAESCRALGDMERCAETCDRCAEICESVAAAAPRGTPARSTRPQERRTQ